jgi:hypothetical protein
MGETLALIRLLEGIDVEGLLFGPAGAGGGVD